MKSKNLQSAIILGGLAFFGSLGHAGVIDLSSSAANTTNSTSSPTLDIPANPAWSTFANTSWVSYTQSGNPYASNFVLVPNGTIVTFTDTFTINGTPTGGTVSVMADDTTSVSLNGTALMAAASTLNNTYATCSDFAIGCTNATAGKITLNGLKSGVNTLTFNVEQIAGTSYGLDYSGQVNYTAASSAPEPQSGVLALMALPIIAFVIVLRKRLAEANQA